MLSLAQLQGLKAGQRVCSTGQRLYSTAAAKALQTLKNPSLVQTKGFINGQWVEGSESYEIHDPALFPKPEAKLIEVTSLTEKDYYTAIDAADKAFHTFKKTSGRYRSDLLLKLYQLMKDNQDDLAKLIVLENGKPYADAYGEISYAASYFQWFSEVAPRVTGDILPSSNPSNRILSVRQPVGPCGIITPFNFPSAMITRKLAAALAVGCTSVIKPAGNVALSALALAKLTEEAGFPKGVINVLPTTDSPAAGKIICEHPKIKKVSATGSTRLGKILMTQSSSTLKKLSFELGGNAPFIVFEDADVDKAVDGAIASKFRSSGQTCVCANRLFVHESVYDEFAKKFVEKVAKTTVMGHGLDEGVTHGPLIDGKSVAKVVSHIENAVSLGAKVLLGGGKRPDLGENFHDLTILGDVTPEMIIFHEETFGPVAPLIKFSSDEQVLALANDTDVGLAGYFYSQNINKIFNIAENLEVGMIGINTGAISEAALPFGGVHESGFGREGSIYGIEDYTVIKSLVIGGLQ